MLQELTRAACIPNDQPLINGLIFGNLLIFIAYCLIPLQLFRIVNKVKAAGLEMPEHKISRLFKAFIFACGCTHLFAALVFFFPIFHVENMIIWITAIVSLATSYILYKEVPTVAGAISGTIRLSNLLENHEDSASADVLRKSLNEHEGHNGQ